MFSKATPAPAGDPVLPPGGADDFLDLDFAPVDLDTALRAIVARGEGAPFAYVVTPNADHVVRLHRRRSDLWPAYRGAWLTLCDSRILAGLARVAGRSLPVVPGSDLTAALLERGIGADDRVAILGGRPETVARVARQYGLRNVAHYDPPMGFVRNPAEVARAVDFVVAARARYVLLAVGSPQQEIVARRIALTGAACGTALCIGASLDFLGGTQERAPMLVRRMSLEWLFRLASDPRRMWRRYLLDSPQIFGIAQSWRRSHMPA